MPDSESGDASKILSDAVGFTIARLANLCGSTAGSRPAVPFWETRAPATKKTATPTFDLSSKQLCLSSIKMNPLKRLGIALWRTLLDQGDLIAMQVLLPPVAGAISKHVRLAVTGTQIGRAHV